MSPTHLLLKLFIDSDDVLLKEKYAEAVKKHNKKLVESQGYFDAGFDLLAPSDFDFKAGELAVIDFKVKVSSKVASTTHIWNTGFFMYPRSSISGTPLRLANSVGVIDSGYRGNLIGKFDCHGRDYHVTQFERLVQIVAPSMGPIYIEIVENVDDLGDKTERGDGGFGSTGKV
jgi:dUTP pyrophosphatase